MIRILQFLCIIIIPLNSVLHAQDVYVATNGNDSNNGTMASPYKTFNKAISVMSASGRNVCIVRGGVYEEELIVNKSGNATNNLIFKAASGENVEIRATSVVNGWQVHNGNIYKANVNMSIESRLRTIYHNDEYMDLARWPNNTDNNRWTLNTIPVTGDGGDKYNRFDVGSMPNMDWTGGLVYYVGAHSGTSWTRTITSNTTTRINHSGVLNKWPFNPHNPGVWRPYDGNNRGQLFLFNKLEALDYAREWYYDSVTQTLYFQPANGTIPVDGEVEYATRRYTAKLNGNYIQVEDINFFGGSVLIKGSNNTFLSNTIIHGNEGHDDLTNTSANVGNAALEVRGFKTTVKGCTINHSATNGITVERWSGAHETTIEENYISNIDYLGIHTTPIRSLANNVKVLKNTIVNAARDGMYVSGDNSEVAYNDVSFSEIINSDSGVFYTVGNNDLKNIDIHHNWFHDATAPAYSHADGESAKAAGIYLDNNSKGYTVHHNVIWNVSWTGYQVNWNNTDLDFYHNTIWNASAAMGSWVNGYPQENNKVYNNFSNKADWFRGNGSAEFDVQNNLIDEGASPFEDVNNQNFMPKNGTILIDNAMVIDGFPKSFKGAAADLGAYEKGGTMWTAGVNAIVDSGEPLSVSELDTTVSLKLYPNPTSSFLNIRLSSNQSFDKTTSVAIYSIMGNLLKSISPDDIKTSTRIPVQDLSTGVYLIKITSQQAVYSGKFVKK